MKLLIYRTPFRRIEKPLVVDLCKNPKGSFKFAPALWVDQDVCYCDDLPRADPGKYVAERCPCKECK